MNHDYDYKFRDKTQAIKFLGENDFTLDGRMNYFVLPIKLPDRYPEFPAHALRPIGCVTDDGGLIFANNYDDHPVLAECEYNLRRALQGFEANIE